MKKIFTRGFWTKKRIIWLVILVVGAGIIGSVLASRGGGNNTIQTDTVKKQHIEQTVLSTGQVVSETDLSLSFQASGIVRQVLVREGSHVGGGQTLAVLDQSSAQATLTSARGALAQAQANYDKILAGASNEDIEVSKAAVKSAETTLQSAYSTFLNSGLAALPATTNSSNGTITVGGNYTGQEEGKNLITIYGTSYDLKGLDLGYGNIIRGVALPVGTHGLYLTFSNSGSFSNGDTWTIPIPNLQASNYLANFNAYQSAKSALEQAKASLALKQISARKEDLDAARAAILSAQGQVDAAQNTLNNTVLRAPSGGTITKVAIKVGELASAQQEVLVLQDVDTLHAEANVSEADIASIKVGQTVDYTFDALGPDRHFKGKVQVVNPASTVISGVVNYKVTASVDNAPDIKPGMTANMTVLIAQKDDALVVPSTAIINKDGKKYVRVIKDSKLKTYEEIEVKTGLSADGGVIEILNGLSEGQEIVTSL